MYKWKIHLITNSLIIIEAIITNIKLTKNIHKVIKGINVLQTLKIHKRTYFLTWCSSVCEVISSFSWFSAETSVTLSINLPVPVSGKVKVNKPATKTQHPQMVVGIYQPRGP